MTELPTRTAFEECRGTKFRVDVGTDAAAEFELVEVRGLRPDSSKPNGRPFSLLFHGPAAQVLPQKIYPMVHERLGAFDLFVVPVGRDATAMKYEAVFN